MITNETLFFLVFHLNTYIIELPRACLSGQTQTDVFGSGKHRPTALCGPCNRASLVQGTLLMCGTNCVTGNYNFIRKYSNFRNTKILKIVLNKLRNGNNNFLREYRNFCITEILKIVLSKMSNGI